MNYGSVILDFIGWWYSGGVKKLFKLQGAYYKSVSNSFAIPEVLKTFFSPWKRILGARRLGIAGFWNAVLDNTISRLVGVTMRSLLLFIYLIVMIVYVVFSVFSLIFWLGFPAIFVGGLIMLVLK